MDVHGMDLDFDYLMEHHHMRMRPDGKAEIELSGLVFTLILDGAEVLSRGGDAIVAGLEKEIRS
jgi:hypothetical protein